MPDGCVIHSFRHSLRDRLRAVNCSSDMMDEIGGWSTASVGHGYGEGCELLLLTKLMRVLSQIFQYIWHLETSAEFFKRVIYFWAAFIKKYLFSKF